MLPANREVVAGFSEVAFFSITMAGDEVIGAIAQRRGFGREQH
jgi:hypothetical protein